MTKLMSKLFSDDLTLTV